MRIARTETTFVELKIIALAVNHAVHPSMDVFSKVTGKRAVLSSLSQRSTRATSYILSILDIMEKILRLVSTF